VLIFFWRFIVFPKMAAGVVTKIVVIGSGKDIDDLQEKLRLSNNSLISICRVVNPKDLPEVGSKEILKTILKEERAHVMAVDLSNPSVQFRLNSLYELIFEGVQFVDVQEVYEDVMDKVPLGIINEAWFLEHVSMESNVIYNSLKRIMDICITLPLMVIPLITYPFIWIAIKLEDGGVFFYNAERIGEKGERIKMSKIRSMSVMDEGTQLGQHANKITKVGRIVRITRLDEFAQLWSVLKGDLSLIGPRPEFPKLVDLYIKEIPHYNVRHLIKPGLSGWAQIHHEKPPHSVAETVDKLAYDLYYIKHRSFVLDIKIALQTIKTLLSRVGV
jgi:lipopolysaccharide/colanic/teichoic acid biosynthesis glycosyltransferase